MVGETEVNIEIDEADYEEEEHESDEDDEEENEDEEVLKIWRSLFRWKSRWIDEKEDIEGRGHWRRKREKGMKRRGEGMGKGETQPK